MTTVAISYPFEEKIDGTGVTGSTVTLTFETVATGRYRRYERFGGIDVTSAVTKLRFIVRGHGYDHLISEENTLTANVLYWDAFPITLTEGEYMVAEFTGTVTNDVLHIYSKGVEGPLGEVR